MKKTAEEQIISNQIIIDYEPFFFMLKDVLGGVILFKYASQFLNAASQKVKKWERLGLIKTCTIAGNKLIILQKNRFLSLNYTPRLTPSLIFRSCLRMDKYAEMGLTSASEIYNRALKGGDRAGFGGNLIREALERQEKILNEKGFHFTLSTPEAISGLEQLKGRNIFMDGVAYDTKEDKPVIKPTFSYYLLRAEDKKKVSRELMRAYHIAQAIYRVEGVSFRPRFTVYMYGPRSETLKAEVYKILSNQPEFKVQAAKNEDFIPVMFKFKVYKRPFSYIDVENVV